MQGLHRTILLAATESTEIIMWAGALIGAVILLTVVVVWVRRTYLASQQPTSNAAGLMEHLRALHARGEITNGEFDSIRTRMAEHVRRVAHEQPRPKSEKPKNANAEAILRHIDRSRNGPGREIMDDVINDQRPIVPIGKPPQPRSDLPPIPLAPPRPPKPPHPPARTPPN